jgi:hydroxyethylthiazole kinase
MMKEVYEIFQRVKQKKPLVHHITNWVTIYDCANITRAFGALPVMAHARQEVEEMVGQASALVLNIGTLTPEMVDSMILAAKAANEKKIPVILDAVGAGATKYRSGTPFKILDEAKLNIVKGNYSEIGVIAGLEAKVMGVESVSFEGDPVKTAQTLSEELDITVVMTGKQDITSGTEKTFLIDNGDSMMGSIVGTGCMSASVIGCFAAVELGHSLASAAALSCFGIAGEIAAKKARGPGSFKEEFFDAVANLSQKDIEEMGKIKQL